jgi:UDP-N-acetylmuramoylalanine--D-glutamate ligase
MKPENPKLKEFAQKYQGKKVLIMGLGLHGGGTGSAQFFAQIGAQVIVADLKKARDLKPSLEKLKKIKNIKYVLGGHRNQDFKNASLIIKNPAVPSDSSFLLIAKKNRIPVDTDIGIFFELCPARIIGITGTKGKSTTAALAYQLIKEHRPAVLAGNIRTSVLEILPQISSKHQMVLELSSWQLEGLSLKQKSPWISVITRIGQEHLNRYASFKDYLKAKKLIFKFQTKKDYLILNAQDPFQKNWAREARSQVLFFNQKNLVEPLLTELRLPGKHNQENALAALAVARLLKIPETKIKKALAAFQGLEGRMELVKKIKGIQFINDTTATAPLAVIKALETLKQPIILIAGGVDKNLDYQKLAQVVSKKTKALILLPGSATEKLKEQLAHCGKPDLIKLEVKNMEQAVRAARQLAKAGDTVLLSPGAASFNLFTHEFARGQTFVKEVEKLN